MEKKKRENKVDEMKEEKENSVRNGGRQRERIAKRV